MKLEIRPCRQAVGEFWNVQWVGMCGEAVCDPNRWYIDAATSSVRDRDSFTRISGERTTNPENDHLKTIFRFGFDFRP
jgi:hypothetical protein